MVCCLLCFDDGPVTGEKGRSNFNNKFQKSMHTGCCKPNCILGMACSCCCAYSLRRRALGNDMSRYRCCQGYMDGCCCGCPKSGQCCESTCPELCLCIEASCCVELSISTTRLYVMDAFELTNDACDNRLIRFANCLQALSCICNILSIFVEQIRECAVILDIIAECVTLMTMGCMVNQIMYELDYQGKNGNGQVAVVVAREGKIQPQ